MAASSERRFMRNEFARVALDFLTDDGITRLRITDLKTGTSAYLCPLILEALAVGGPDQLRRLADPGLTVWNDGPAAPTERPTTTQLER